MDIKYVQGYLRKENGELSIQLISGEIIREDMIGYTTHYFNPTLIEKLTKKDIDILVEENAEIWVEMIDDEDEFSSTPIHGYKPRLHKGKVIIII